ncbi:MAG: type II toxin-antitoxin system prevent-host-death family antitoxin [Alkalispirochaeta sp.]
MQVNMYEAKPQFSRLVAKALAGEEVIIAKNGKPVVRLTSIVAPQGTRTPGLSRDQARIRDDFDAPLPDEVIEQFER